MCTTCGCDMSRAQRAALEVGADLDGEGPGDAPALRGDDQITLTLSRDQVADLLAALDELGVQRGDYGGGPPRSMAAITLWSALSEAGGPA